MVQNIKFLRLLPIFLMGGLLAWSCANRGSGPQGGPKDMAPPIPMASKPENGAKNVTKKHIEINFNEIVTLDGVFEKVIVSPPQLKAPAVKALSRRVVVDLADSLRENTTYIIDFADAIVDNNEKNPLKDYYFSFSTGETLDSLMLGGMVIDAATLNPVPGTLVGLHKNHADSTFTTQPFDYVAKTNKEGKFWLKGIGEGAYRIYALGDLNSNFAFNRGETLAFLDSIFVPNIEFTETFDTVWADSITIDTIRRHTHPKYTAGVVLRNFAEDFVRHSFIKAERTERYKMSLYFNGGNDSLPTIEPLNFAMDSVQMQANEKADTLTFWLADTLTWQLDTLSYVLTYQKTDSTDNLAWQSDTLHTVYRAKKSENSSKSSKEKQSKKKEFLTLKTNLSTKFDVYSPVELTFDVPTTYNDSLHVWIEQKIDTTWQPLRNVELQKINSIGMKYAFSHDWKPEGNYRLMADSAAFVGLNGLHTKQTENPFRIKSLENYATLYVIVENLQGNEIIELLDKSEKVVRTKPAQPGETVFEYLNPGDYYLRLFIDQNGNGKWDTGNFAEHQQPEELFYYEYKLQLRAFWEVEEHWNYRAKPITEQKPKELIKNAKQR